MMIKLKHFFYLVLLAGFTSCIPARLMEEAKAKLNSCETELATLKKNCQENETELAELKNQSAKAE
jgi:septal ring factor EnvC (AmiA/AmiB activator)